MTLPIGWFSTGRDDAALWLLRKTLDAIRAGFLPLEIAFVFCNREIGDAPESDAFLAFVQQQGLPLIAFSSRRFLPDLWRRGKEGDSATLQEWRRRYHEEVARRLAPFLDRVPFSFLAGYMLIVSDDFCERYTLLNLHPALPGGPKGTWQEVIWQLIRQRAQWAGAQIHLVTPELDSGPPVSFCRLPLQTPELRPLWEALDVKLRRQTLDAIIATEGEREPLFAAIRQRELRRELPLILLTLKKLAQGEIHLRDKQVLWHNSPAPHGVDLTEEVEAFLEAPNIYGTGDSDDVGRI
ncbi:Phosphoribosylglycinamide formyltransferase [bacterium HR17]|uniref:phosphoribosylglycinamide formyltransferase 1 n=1 Tax=Candidatus Fervidibacter japonicus TaxID=2035412 RepID=A0A2H5X8U7_9BACT|nr:Phosphoribosylglycinamide formyltransferase [bacterium HR17]